MIYYSHVNEDSTPEQTIMASATFSNLVAVAGSGERVIALLDHGNLEQINIIDPNVEALYITELKITALHVCTVPEYLFFIGFKSSCKTHEDRTELFVMVLKSLTENCAMYWSANHSIITSGKLLESGHFESFLSRVSAVVRFLFYTKIDSMMYRPYVRWGNYEKFLWEILSKVFTYKIPYLLMGNRDPAFIHANAERHTISNAFQKSFNENGQLDSFFMHLLFYGNLHQMTTEVLPDSLSEIFLTRVKKSLSQKSIKISYHQKDLRAYLEEEKEFSNTFISTSDVLSFELPKYMNSILKLVADPITNKSNHIVWRSFLRHRNLYDTLVKRTDQKHQDISHYDKTNMYKVYSMNF